MRAMAILYIGPHRNPDFQSDYQLSPILAPDHLLAQFPPLLMTCGEKDPFVDDTLVFAGRVREAKRARRAELERIIAGKSSQYGEHLRMSMSMSGHEPAGHDEAMRMLRRETERLAAETEEDWVRMVIFSEWSHGYLQMPALMPEARGVIDDLADWIDEAFTKNNDNDTGLWSSSRDGDDGIPSSVSDGRRGASNFSPSPSSYSTQSPRPRRWSRTVAGVRDRVTDGLTSSATETELDTDEVLSFSPKRRSPPTSYADMRRGSNASTGTVPRPSTSSGQSGKKTSTSTSTPTLKARSPPRAPGGLTGEMRSDMLHEAPTVDALLPSASAKRRTSSPAGGNGPPTPTTNKGGQTITESELMRRRRLLDSHLIPQSQDSVK